MPLSLQLEGRRFDRLMVLKRAPFNRNHKAYWICTCDCGASVTVCGGNLRNGSIKSCGCLKAEHARILRLVHGDKRTKSGKIASEWRAWRSMIERCENAANASFSRYGGRGITICAEWRDDYRSFLKYLGRKPTPKHSLDRIDNDGNYEPGNVRWATAKEQANNRSNSR